MKKIPTKMFTKVFPTLKVFLTLKVFSTLVIFLVLQGCGLAIKETKQEIDKLTITETYRLGVKYYSDGFINEAEYLYKEAINKYEKSENLSDEDKKSYLWCLYEIAFINYTKNNIEISESYLEKLFKDAGTFGNRLPQVILGQKLISKIKLKRAKT